MSAASRRREYCRRYQHGFPTFAAFRAWQEESLARWLTSLSPLLIAARRTAFEEAWANGVPQTYPEIPDDSPPFA